MIRVPRRRPNLSLHGSRMLYLLSAGRQMPFTREAFVFMPSGFVADFGATHTRKPPRAELHNARPLHGAAWSASMASGAAGRRSRAIDRRRFGRRSMMPYLEVAKVSQGVIQWILPGQSTIGRLGRRKRLIVCH